MAHSGRINQQKLSLEKDLIADILDKDFKTNVLTPLKELKDVEKVKKTMGEQNGNTNKMIEN